MAGETDWAHVKDREFLFLSHTLATGGIESLLVRMTNALVGGGHDVTLIAPVGPMAEYLDPRVRWTRTELPNRDLANFIPVTAGRAVDIWCSLPSIMIESWPLQKILWSRFKCRSSCTSGIFHPDQWFHSGRGSAAYWQGRLIQALADQGSIYFMNDASRAAHIPRWGRHIKRFPVFRLHLENKSTVDWKPLGQESLKILSVGRIVPFKMYNTDAAAILTDLAQKGIDARWDIFGDGEDRDKLVAQATATGLGRQLRFPGELAYGDFATTCLDYDLFIGMGTAALEAAMTAMPTLLAVSGVSRGCYGFLHEAPSDSVAELVEGVPPVDLFEQIVPFARTTCQERIDIGQRCRRSAIERSGGERPPFSAMFAAGRHYPATAGKRLRAEVLYTAYRARKSLGGLSKP